MSTSTERSRKFREKLKGDQEKLSEYQRKDRERKALEHAKFKANKSEKEKAEHRLKRAEIQRRWRAKVKGKGEGKQNSSAANDYKSPQSLGKAVRRVQKHLPKSPSKVPHVLAKVVQAMSPGKRKSVIEAVDSSSKKRKPAEDPRKQRSDALSDKSIKEVEEFYRRDDISRMCPGKKDCVSVKTSKGREVRQKRLLLYNIAEVHQMFNKRESDTSIGLSKFASLRPPEVIPITLRDQEVCVCKYHENIELLLSGISKAVPGVSKTADEMLCKTVCSTNDAKCMERDCSKCDVEGSVNDMFDECNEDQSVSYYQWETSDDGIVRKVQVNCNLGEAKDDLIVQLQPFGRHVYNIRRQYIELAVLKETLAPGEIIVHEDFAENFQLKHQREIMAAHWHNEMVTVFTAVVYYRDDEGELQHLSYAVVSDELSHDKSSVYAYNSLILEDVKKVTEVKKVHYWSDGPSSQFKNRYNLSIVVYHERDFGCDATWNFFETAHGKGPCDGIGGEVKRVVWRAILQSSVVVTSAKEFADTAKQLCKKIRVLYCSEDQVGLVTEKLSTRWNSCKAIPSTHSIHFVAKVDEVTIKVAKNSQFSQQDCCQEHVLISKSPLSHQPSGKDSKQVPAAVKKDPGQKAATRPCATNSNRVPASVVAKETGQVKAPNLATDFGLPPMLKARFRNPGHVTAIPHKAQLLSGIINGQVKFKGKGVISPNDLSSLQGGHAKEEDNFLTNFAVDTYLEMLQTASPNIVVFPWEQFEKSSIIKRQLSAKGKLLEKDLIIAPCCPAGGNHWFLVVAIPKEKSIFALDSLAGSFIKPTAEAAMCKMWHVLKKADSSLDIATWRFASNKPGDLPQQANGIDCGVFLLMYARCLATGAPMLCKDPDIPAVREQMILELHYQALLPPQTSIIEKDQYYAVDYVKKYYIGRALDASSDGFLIPFKFLYYVGAQKFGWPIRDDAESVHPSCVFHGPLALQGNGPFEVPNLDEVEAVFKLLKK